MTLRARTINSHAMAALFMALSRKPSGDKRFGWQRELGSDRVDYPLRLLPYLLGKPRERFAPGLGPFRGGLEASLSSAQNHGLTPASTVTLAILCMVGI